MAKPTAVLSLTALLLTAALPAASATAEVDLPAGARATHTLRAYFAGSSTTQEVSEGLEGPFQGTWRFRHRVADESLNWLPCGQRRQLNLMHSITVHSGTSTEGAWARMSKLASPRLVWGRC